MPSVFAFDVDETIEISRGPVTLQMMADLRYQGHIVGLCGNWGLFCQVVSNWHQFVSFINLGLPKHEWLIHFRQILPHYDDYVLVGNVPGAKNRLGVVCGSDDIGAARAASWRFLKEDDFASGSR